MMWRIVEKQITVEGKTAMTYGIGCENYSVHDISTDKEEMMLFVEKLNKYKASVIHAPDLIEDFLGR